MKKKLLIGFMALLSIFLFVGCASVEKRIFAMGTVIDINISGGKSSKAYAEMESLITSVESLVSTNYEESEIYKINNAVAGAEVEISDLTEYLFDESIKLYNLTDGAFNPFLYPLVKLWGFTSTFNPNNATIPLDADIERLRAVSSPEMFEKVKKDSKTYLKKLSSDAGIDFGGIAKGYVADKCAEIAKKHSIKDAIINIGGNIYLLGREFKAGIAHPRDSSKVFATLKLQNQSIVTSGDYERYFEKDGVRYCHIIDSSTAAPIGGNVASISVVGENSMYCDALATAFCVLSEEKIQEIMQKFTTEFDMEIEVFLIDKALGYRQFGDKFNFEIRDK